MPPANNDDEIIEIVIHSPPHNVEDNNEEIMNESKCRWDGLFKAMICGLFLIFVIGFALFQQSKAKHVNNGRELEVIFQQSKAKHYNNGEDFGRQDALEMLDLLDFIDTVYTVVNEAKDCPVDKQERIDQYKATECPDSLRRWDEHGIRWIERFVDGKNPAPQISSIVLFHPLKREFVMVSLGNCSNRDYKSTFLGGIDSELNHEKAELDKILNELDDLGKKLGFDLTEFKFRFGGFSKGGVYALSNAVYMETILQKKVKNAHHKCKWDIDVRTFGSPKGFSADWLQLNKEKLDRMTVRRYFRKDDPVPFCAMHRVVFDNHYPKADEGNTFMDKMKCLGWATMKKGDEFHNVDVYKDAIDECSEKCSCAIAKKVHCHDDDIG